MVRQKLVYARSELKPPQCLVEAVREAVPEVVARHLAEFADWGWAGHLFLLACRVPGYEGHGGAIASAHKLEAERVAIVEQFVEQGGFQLPEERANGGELVVPPVLQQPRRLRGYAPLRLGQLAPSVHLPPHAVDDVRQLVLLLGGVHRGRFGIERQLALVAAALPRLRHRRDERRLTAALHLPIGGLPVVVEFPMPTRVLVGRVQPAEPVRDRTGAVGQPDAGASGRVGSGGASAAVQAAVRAGAARRGSQGVRVAWRASPAVGGRHGALLVADGALRPLLREGAQGRDEDVPPPVAVRGAGASGASGGSAGGSAGADPESGRGEGLASNGPHARLLKELDMRFVLGAKPGDHKALFAWMDELEATPPAPGAKPGVERWETTDADGVEHRFRWSNGAPLNDANMDLEVNFLEYWERRPNGGEKRFSWVTDLRVDRWNAMDLMRAGGRWRIENQTRR